MKMSHSLKTSLFVGAVALASLFSSCEKDDETTPTPKPEPIDPPPVTEMPVDTLKNLSYFKEIGILDEIKDDKTFVALFSAFHIAEPVKSSEAKATTEMNITMPLPLENSSLYSVKAHGSIKVTAKEGYNLFTVKDPQNAGYKGVVTSMDFPVSPEKTKEGKYRYFYVEGGELKKLSTKTGFSREMYLEAFRESLVSIVAEINSTQDNPDFQITIKAFKSNGEVITVTNPEQIDFENDTKVTISGSTSVRLGTTLLGQNFDRNDGARLGWDQAFSGEGFGIDGEKGQYMFSTGTALKP